MNKMDILIKVNIIWPMQNVLFIPMCQTHKYIEAMKCVEELKVCSQ